MSPPIFRCRPLRGRGVVYEATVARTYGQLLKPHRTLRQRSGQEGIAFPLSAEEVVGPAVLVNQVGRGMVITLACSPGEAAASDFLVAEARQLLPNAVRHLLPDPLVTIESPRFVEAVTTREGNTLRIHLLGRCTPATATPPKNRPYALPSLVEDLPLYRVRLQFREQLAAVRAFNRTTELHRKSAHEVRATIEDLHEVIVIEF